LTNLIVNGIKYGRKNGFVQVSFHDLDENIMVEVTDNGIGIEKRTSPRIFERFTGLINRVHANRVAQAWAFPL
jgi:two-component system, OmpR family, phosphate regulon sensor histidine kinase PhoR